MTSLSTKRVIIFINIPSEMKIILFIVCIFSACLLHDRVHDYYERIYIKNICEEEGGLKSKGSVYVDGFLFNPRSHGSHMVGTLDAFNWLYIKKFDFIEVPVKKVSSPHGHWSVGEGDKHNGYVKFTIHTPYNPGNTPECKAYEMSLRNLRHGGPSYKVEILENEGFPDNACIKSEVIDLPTSTYKTNRMELEQHITPTEMPWISFQIPWVRYEIRNIKNNTTHARYQGFRYCFDGKKKSRTNGATYCKGGEENTFHCPGISPNPAYNKEFRYNIIFSTKDAHK